MQMFEGTFEVALRRAGLARLHEHCQRHKVADDNGEGQADHERHGQRTVQ